MTTTTARRAKKNLNQDQLVTTTFRLTEWAQAHFNQVIIGVVALVAVVAVLVFVANSRESGAKQAEREMGSAITMMGQGQYATAKENFQQVADRFGGAQGASARFFKAECELHQNDYKAAADDYDAYLARVKDYPMFEGSALMGKALALEGLGNYLEAANSMAAAVDKIDVKDPRHFDAAYSAGEFYQHAGHQADAIKFFDLVAKDGTGDLKERATVSAALLK
ncbi:MAG TPA: tetratricopeptide repeat protein [Candidatus Krumholzibacteria bacterium]|nr:tetratricopeptide repeat protein [Candidatus Krumholzibacteria bacterium]